jgi:hypothetical protein
LVELGSLHQEKGKEIVVLTEVKKKHFQGLTTLRAPF